jgi:hypothetical protein
MNRRQLMDILVGDSIAMTVLDDWRTRVLLPCCEAAAGLGTEDHPSLLAVVGDSLLSVTLGAASDDETRSITVKREPLDRERGTVTLVESTTGPPQRLGRRRSWIFVPAHGAEPIEIVTEQLLTGGFPDQMQPSQLERLARAVARRLGYEIPDDERSQ